MPHTCIRFKKLEFSPLRKQSFTRCLPMTVRLLSHPSWDSGRKRDAATSISTFKIVTQLTLKHGEMSTLKTSQCQTCTKNSNWRKIPLISWAMLLHFTEQMIILLSLLSQLSKRLICMLTPLESMETHPSCIPFMDLEGYQKVSVDFVQFMEEPTC